MKRLSRDKRLIAETVLGHAANVQTLYWDLLHDLEELLDCEINNTVDLMAASVDDLRRGDGNA